MDGQPVMLAVARSCWRVVKRDERGEEWERGWKEVADEDEWWWASREKVRWGDERTAASCTCWTSGDRVKVAAVTTPQYKVRRRKEREREVGWWVISTSRREVKFEPRR